MRKLLAFLIPLALYSNLVFLNTWVMSGYKNCDLCFSCYAPLGCASDTRVLIADIFGYSALGLLLLAFLLPFIIWRRERSQKTPNLFKVVDSGQEK
jgi:hypothetical protein